MTGIVKVWIITMVAGSEVEMTGPYKKKMGAVMSIHSMISIWRSSSGWIRVHDAQNISVEVFDISQPADSGNGHFRECH